MRISVAPVGGLHGLCVVALVTAPLPLTSGFQILSFSASGFFPWLLILIFTPLRPPVRCIHNPRHRHAHFVPPCLSLTAVGRKNDLFPEDNSQLRTVSVIDWFRCRFAVKNSFTCKVGGSVGGLRVGGGGSSRETRAAVPRLNS